MNQAKVATALSKAREMTGGEIIAHHLIREGVTPVFDIPGHGDAALMGAFIDREAEISPLPAMHEQNSAHMADGFYRSSGGVAAVVSSIGPGATSTMTGIAATYANTLGQVGVYDTSAARGLPGRGWDDALLNDRLFDAGAINGQLCFGRLVGQWVVDASVLPLIATGNTDAPKPMTPIKGADMILEDRMGRA